jgi:UDP-2,4-diacetamido-2,4,6-trideoxy-beta-L-altropyranose hydrolase
MTSGRQSLLIRADASTAIGTGHAMRCLALAKTWQGTGGQVNYLMAESIPALEDRFAREGVTVTRIAAAPGMVSDAEQTVAEARRLGARWVVADGYRFEPDYIRKLKAAGLRVLSLDDDGRFDFYSADIVLNQNISANSAMYAKREPFTRLLLGSEYVLLRPEFLAESRTREFPAAAWKVLVTMGGSDPENVTKKVLLAVLKIEANIEVNIEARIVVGSGNPWQDEVQVLAAQRAGLQLERSPENMAPLMRWADIVISGAGSTCWELAYLGLPAIVIALSRDQLEIARGLAENEVAVSLGWHANLSEERISDALNRLLSDQERRRAMSERGQKLVDGRGAERVVAFLQSSL